MPSASTQNQKKKRNFSAVAAVAELALSASFLLLLSPVN